MLTLLSDTKNESQIRMMPKWAQGHLKSLATWLSVHQIFHADINMIKQNIKTPHNWPPQTASNVACIIMSLCHHQGPSVWILFCNTASSIFISWGILWKSYWWSNYVWRGQMTSILTRSHWPFWKRESLFAINNFRSSMLTETLSIWENMFIVLPCETK